MTGSNPIGANSVTPMPNAPMERAISPGLSFIVRSSDQGRIEAGKALLLAIRRMRIRRQHVARRVERGDLLIAQHPADRAEILAKLLFVAGTDDYRGHGRAAQEPVDRDLGYGLPGFGRDRL